MLADSYSNNILKNIKGDIVNTIERMNAIRQRITQDHVDVYEHTLRTLKSIDELDQQHKLLVASQSIAGIKPDGEDEQDFYRLLAEMKDREITVLEKELEDWEHRHEKGYKKNYE